MHRKLRKHQAHELESGDRVNEMVIDSFAILARLLGTIFAEVIKTLTYVHNNASCNNKRV